jgi:hypothetical protein
LLADTVYVYLAIPINLAGRCPFAIRLRWLGFR